ncbi:putative response regulatory protein [compost metagenome]
MLRICLVEDEEYALKSLQQKIMDLNGPYEVVGTAYNGLDALDVIAKTYPDVVITDIRMPDMDGIALLECIDAHYKNIITVIISGYQDFEYAKKAIQFGVEDYLLKPVVSHELRDCLQQCGDKVNTLSNSKHIDDVLSESSPIQWVDTEYFLIYLIFGNPLSNPESVIHPNGFYIPSQEIEQKFNSMVPGLSLALCFIGVCSNEKVIIIQKENMTESILSHKLHQMATDLEREYKYSVTFSYTAMEKTDRIDAKINLIRKIATQSVLPGMNSIVSEMPRSEYVTQNINDFITYFALYIRQAMYNALNAKIQALFDEWQARCYPLCAVQNDLIYIANSLKHSLSISDNFEFTVTYYIENIISISGTYTDLANQFYHFIVELFELSSDTNGQILSPAQLVDKIEQYFHSNLSSNLTLSMLCSEMNYSKAYLCRVFKKQTNLTPIDYFIHLKIERAKTIIQECPSMSVKDIANSLGFNDTYYFSKVFKRITGRPPTAVREHVLTTTPEGKE